MRLRPVMLLMLCNCYRPLHLGALVVLPVRVSFVRDVVSVDLDCIRFCEGVSQLVNLPGKPTGGRQ